MKLVGVIPARYASTRLPAKPLADIHGKPMIVRVYERAARCAALSSVLVATDDERIASACASHGVRAVMTRLDHPSGTDRIHEAAGATDADVIVNIQGDEPLLDPAYLDALVAPLAAIDPALPIAASLCAPLTDEAGFHDPNVVKVVLAASGQALYFSRAPVPFPREGGMPDTVYRHLGFYAYTRAALAAFVALPPSLLERTEKLEQLRLLENGIPILMSVVPRPTQAVDTPADLERVRGLWTE